MDLYTIDTPVQDLKEFKVMPAALANALLRGYDYRNEVKSTYDVTLKHIANEYTIAEIKRFRCMGDYKLNQLIEIYDKFGYVPKDGKFQSLKNDTKEASKVEPTILPCPFCGGHDIGVKDSVLEEKAYCYCRNCHSQGPIVHISEDSGYTDEQVIALTFIKWNERQ